MKIISVLNFLRILSFFISTKKLQIQARCLCQTKNTKRLWSRYLGMSVFAKLLFDNPIIIILMPHNLDFDGSQVVLFSDRKLLFLIRKFCNSLTTQ